MSDNAIIPQANGNGSVGEASTSQQENPASLSAAVNSVSQALQRSNIECTFKHQAKDKYTFWETQPVTQFGKDGVPIADGPIDVPKSIADVRQDPYNLPDSFVWSICNLADAAQVHEVYELLSNNYVEDDDNMFRFNYSAAFLKWALQPPGHKPEWLLGVRVASNNKLVGFISAVPAHIRPTKTVLKMVEINFLCVHKKLRAKRLAPVLIKEITRRVNLHGIWQAAYTAGVLIPKPIATCRYWHRSLNPKKLIDIGFSRLAPRMTMVRTVKLYKVPDLPLTPGLRVMTAKDVPAVVPLLNNYLAGFKLAQVFDEEEAAHWFTPQENVVDAYVVEDPITGVITDMLSFYTLPSTILGHPEHTELKAAYMYYTVPGSTPLKQLMGDAMILARGKGYDVFNALDLLQNADFIKELKFGMGDGLLHYYLFNYRVADMLTPQDVGLILIYIQIWPDIWEIRMPPSSFGSKMIRIPFRWTDYRPRTTTNEYLRAFIEGQPIRIQRTMAKTIVYIV